MTSQASVFTAIAVVVIAVGSWLTLSTGDPVVADERTEVEGFKVQEPRPEAIREKSPAPSPSLTSTTRPATCAFPTAAFSRRSTA